MWLAAFRRISFVRHARRRGGTRAVRGAIPLLEGLEDRLLLSVTINESILPTSDGRPLAITSGSDGNLWFTEQNANKIGEINPATGIISEFTIPTAGSSPQGITTGPDGNLWFTEHDGFKIG